MLIASSSSPSRRRALLGGLALLAATYVAATALPAVAQPEVSPETFDSREIIDSGHRFFGATSRGLALAVQEAARRWGEPNGYILGQEASGAVFGGLRYGEGTFYTRNAGQRRIFWQGPSLGFDVGGDGARTMMLVYNLPAVRGLYRRFVGVDGSAYVVGGVSMSAATADNVVVVPIRTGVGARLGINVGYLKFTDQPTWNPF
jgi:hypothetical protein